MENVFFPSSRKKTQQINNEIKTGTIESKFVFYFRLLLTARRHSFNALAKNFFFKFHVFKLS